MNYAHNQEVHVNVYLEDWSNGIRDSLAYVSGIVDALQDLDIGRVLLADTLGVLSPDEVRRLVSVMTVTWPETTFDFHGHNDYGFATANAIAAIQSGARGVHTSVNGLGERAGNTSLAEIVTAIADHTTCKTNVNESRLAAISSLVETFSGKNISENTPILGNDVFTQTAGVHADGDAKGNLYATRLAPHRFGRERRYALGKLSGKASLDYNLEKLGIDLSEANRNKVLNRIIELGDKKHNVVPEDLLMIIADVLKTPAEHVVKIDRYVINVASDRPPEATVTVSFKGHTAEATGTGDGGYDAFMQALKAGGDSARDRRSAAGRLSGAYSPGRSYRGAGGNADPVGRCGGGRHILDGRCRFRPDHRRRDRDRENVEHRCARGCEGEACGYSEGVGALYEYVKHFGTIGMGHVTH